MISFVIPFISIVVAIIIVIVNRYKTKKTIQQLLKMIDSAIDGSFSETTYDESALSALELKLNRYLCQCIVSSKNLDEEKKKIKSLISDISHQTKTPISNILLYSSLLMEEENLSAKNKDMVNQISTQSEKLNFLIGVLIKTSRLETGIINVKPALNSVKELIVEITSQIEQKAEEKEIGIIVNAKAEKAIFDRKWTQEAIYNILENAVKYTPKGGKVEINVIPYEMFCRIDIKDNGIGISEDEHSKIFIRFYRSIKVQQIEGVGIGLFLCREILSAQRGYIKVYSKLGEGSTFSVFLPKA